MWLLDLIGERRARPLLQTAFSEANAELSPDGRWLAYDSNESGRFEVYVRPFPEVDAGRWQVSSGGGSGPMWSPNGRELFYHSEPDRMMSVAIQPGRAYSAGNPEFVLEGLYLAPDTIGRTYDVSADGQRFLMLKEAPRTDPSRSAADCRRPALR